MDAPATTLILPTRPVEAPPVDNNIHPLFPDADDPVARDMVPDTPADATWLVDRMIAPEPPLLLPPLDTTTGPPTAPTL